MDLWGPIPSEPVIFDFLLYMCPILYWPGKEPAWFPRYNGTLRISNIKHTATVFTRREHHQNTIRHPLYPSYCISLPSKMNIISYQFYSVSYSVLYYSASSSLLQLLQTIITPYYIIYCISACAWRNRGTPSEKKRWLRKKVRNSHHRRPRGLLRGTTT